MKKIIAVLASIAMLSSVFSGRSGGNQQIGTSSGAASGGTSTPVSINYYDSQTGGDLDKMGTLVKKFNESQSEIQVTLTSLQWSQMFTGFLADYQVGSAPDVAAMYSFELGRFVDMGILSSDIIKNLNLSSSGYVKAAWDGTLLDDVRYGVPLGMNIHALHYSKDLFRATGIASAPISKGGLIVAAQKPTVDASRKNATESGFDAANIKQYGSGFLQNHHAFYQAFALMNQQGYNPSTNNMTTLSLDSEKTSAAFQLLEDLVYKYKVTPTGEKSPIDDFRADFVMMVTDGNQQLSGADNATEFDWGTAAYLQIFSEKAVWGAFKLLAIPDNKDADKVRAAQIFIKRLSDNSTEQTPSDQIPVDVKIQQAAVKIESIEAYNSELDYVKPLSAHKKSVKVFSSATSSPILTAARNAVLNDKDPAEITKQLKDDINRVLVG